MRRRCQSGRASARLRATCGIGVPNHRRRAGRDRKLRAPGQDGGERYGDGEGHVAGRPTEWNRSLKDARGLIDAAFKELDEFGAAADPLKAVALYLVERTH